MSPNGRDPGPGVNLHLSHARSVEAGRFVEDFARADRGSTNLVLESRGTAACHGIGLRLTRGSDGQVLDEWVLADPISEVRDRHAEHRTILEQIDERFGVAHVYVSSLRGHSLDVFRTGIPTTRVFNEYFPECAAGPLHHGKICTSCTAEDLEGCTETNELSTPIASARYHRSVRDALLDAMAAADVALVSPTRRLADDLQLIEPRFGDSRFTVIEPGLRYEKESCFGGADDDRRLRVGFLGHLGPSDGLGFLGRQFGRLRAVADLHFVGVGEHAREFAEKWGCGSYVASHEPGELPAILRRERLDMALFLPKAPPPFCYSLSEAWCFGIPPVARRVGALGERIDHGIDGFLLEGGDETEVVDFLLEADRDRTRLRDVASRVHDKAARTVDAVVADYYALRAESRAGTPVAF